MANDIIPPPGGRDDIYEVMQKLFDDSRVVKTAHFIAAQRKSRKSSIFGVIVIVLNVLIGSGFIEALFKPQDRATTIIKALAFLAAALAGIQTYFNFQKEVECHKTLGDTYISINHRVGMLMAEYKSKPANRDAVFEKFKELDAEYLKANDDAKACIPSDADYKKAREGSAERSVGNRP
jgi:hypothetical protein